jgi:hypothetical protein
MGLEQVRAQGGAQNRQRARRVAGLERQPGRASQAPGGRDGARPHHLGLRPGARPRVQPHAGGEGGRGCRGGGWHGGDRLLCEGARVAAGAVAVASFLAAFLTEIYLCGICFGQEILRRNGRGPGAGGGRGPLHLGARQGRARGGRCLQLRRGAVPERRAGGRARQHQLRAVWSCASARPWLVSSAPLLWSDRMLRVDYSRARSHFIYIIVI